jgi:ParB family transcriptional regulator, chromosome partitioning protein
MPATPAQRIELIPIDRITVVNPRLRNKNVYNGIVKNIAEIGLKRPITVTQRQGTDGLQYDLVCGQGRLEAFRLLEQDHVPALIVAADPQDCLVASIVENCARRHHNAVDLLQDIGGMRERGYSDQEIAKRVGLSPLYVASVIRLIEKGERRLLRAAEAGYLPISVALEICETDDHGAQAALHNAYEQNLLRGRDLIAARRMVDLRKRGGKKGSIYVSRGSEPVTSDRLVKAFREDSERKRSLVRRAQQARHRLMFIAEAFSQLLEDESFSAVLEDEGLLPMPARLVAHMRNPQRTIS